MSQLEKCVIRMWVRGMFQISWGVDVMGWVEPSFPLLAKSLVSHYLTLWRYEEEVTLRTTAENELVKIKQVSRSACGIVAWESGSPQGISMPLFS